MGAEGGGDAILAPAAASRLAGTEHVDKLAARTVRNTANSQRERWGPSRCLPKTERATHEVSGS
jgi:hypothetical protein